MTSLAAKMAPQEWIDLLIDAADVDAIEKLAERLRAELPDIELRAGEGPVAAVEDPHAPRVRLVHAVAHLPGHDSEDGRARLTQALATLGVPHTESAGPSDAIRLTVFP
jgi:hypothetical protein